MPLRKIYVTEEELRAKFALGRYWERAQSGEFTDEELVRGRPAKSSAQPSDAISRRVAWYDHTGRKTFVVHEFLLSDGTLGASDLPDPKSLREGDTLYISTTRFIPGPLSN